MLFEAIDAVPDGFALYDENDRFVIANAAYRRYYNKSADLFVRGTPFEEIIRDGVARGQYPQAVGHEDAWIEERLRIHREANSDVEQYLDNGRWLRILERRTRSGRTVGFRFDITELVQAREAAKSAARAKADFISMLSHELRTPLTIILGYAKVLANVRVFRSVVELHEELKSDDVDASKVQAGVDHLIGQTTGQAEKMLKSGQHLMLLINDLLDYSKIEAGGLEIHRTELRLDSLLASLVDEMSDMAIARGNDLSYTSEHLTVLADEIRLKQVIINLVGNAIKFTENGTVSITARADGQDIRIDVTDTGCGIDEAHLDAVFAAFQQVDFSDRRKAGGTGLGLAISRNIVELHGGELTLTSEVGIGSTFAVWLPEALADNDRELQGVA